MMLFSPLRSFSTVVQKCTAIGRFGLCINVAVSPAKYFHTSPPAFDWIRRNTPRKPNRYKISRNFAPLEEEQIQVESATDSESNDLCDADFQLYNSLRDRVSASVAENSSRYFAVIHVAGKQFKVTPGDLISIKSPLLEVSPGELIRLEKVILAGNTDFSIVGRPLIPRSNVLVTAMVVEKTLQHPSLWYQFHRRRRHRKMRVFQDNTATLRIVNVEVKGL